MKSSPLKLAADLCRRDAALVGLERQVDELKHLVALRDAQRSGYDLLLARCASSGVPAPAKRPTFAPQIIIVRRVVPTTASRPRARRTRAACAAAASSSDDPDLPPGPGVVAIAAAARLVREGQQLTLWADAP